MKLARTPIFASLVLFAFGCESNADMAPPDMTPFCPPFQSQPRAFQDQGPYGKLRDDLAADFTLTDQAGTWNFKAHWTGESYVFIPDTIPVSSGNTASIWKSDLDDLIARSPQNVHYFFVSRKSDPNASLKLIADQLDGVLSALPEGSQPGQRDWWKTHLHLVQGSGKAIEGWVGEVLSVAPTASPLGHGFAIDRFQRLRGIGSLADVNRNNGSMGWPFDNNMGYAAHPAVYFNYEAERQGRLDAESKPVVITAIDHEMLKLVDERDVTFPDAAAMKDFDTLEIDLTMNCQTNTKYEEWQDSAALDPSHYNCGPWDYIASIEVRDEQDVKKYHEVARFISSYHRAGRFVVDASQALPMLAAGGKHHIRYNLASADWNKQTFDTVMAFRLVNTCAASRPTKSASLFAGGGFNSMYNDNRNPVVVPIPKTAKRVELRAIITGHGADSKDQCAEFCDHHHEFTVNGNKHTQDQPDIGDPEGCVKHVSKGQVPNQSGTWWYGRGGWCPGMQVDPYVVDVTSEVTPGQDATVSYQGLFRDATPMVGLGNIVMNSWLVIYE